MKRPAFKSESAINDDFCCLKRLIDQQQQPKQKQEQSDLFGKYQRRFFKITRRLRYQRNFIAIKFSPTLMTIMIFATAATLALILAQTSLCLSTAGAVSLGSTVEHQQQQQQHQRLFSGGLEPGDYIDEGGELDVMANQPQIPTAQLMAAAGHIVPENFFLPGGSIPVFYPRYVTQQQQHQQQLDPMQQMASHLQTRFLSPSSIKQYLRQADLMQAASEQHESTASLIDFNGYNLITGQSTEARDPAGSAASTQASAAVAGVTAQGPAAMDLVEFLAPSSSQTSTSFYEQQQQQQQYAEQQQLPADIVAIQQQQQQGLDNVAQTSDNSLSSSQAEHYASAASAIGPAYQISGHPDSMMMASPYGGSGAYNKDQMQKPLGMPTKSSSKEPSGMLKPLGNPSIISSPAIDFVTNQLPKNTVFEKLAEKLPQTQTPTVFSFSSSKDPLDKAKGISQKKRNVMRQAEQLARMMIKSVNEKFGTNIGDQTDIPFLLSSVGPLGLAQNLLLDPTLLVTLLNSAEKTYLSDVLPGPAKMAIRPVLNIFRVPNKKRDKANLLNIISYLASGGQTLSNTPSKHRQGTGIERKGKSKK